MLTYLCTLRFSDQFSLCQNPSSSRFYGYLIGLDFLMGPFGVVSGSQKSSRIKIRSGFCFSFELSRKASSQRFANGSLGEPTAGAFDRAGARLHTSFVPVNFEFESVFRSDISTPRYFFINSEPYKLIRLTFLFTNFTLQHIRTLRSYYDKNIYYIYSNHNIFHGMRLLSGKFPHSRSRRKRLENL